jgi:outer membrane protein OmpA-like peptidoglycan-associated protein
MLLLICPAVASGQQYVIERLPSSVNSDYEEVKPILSRSGDSLFFVRDYAPENAGGAESEEDIWLSIFSEEAGWLEATNQFGYPNKPGPDVIVGSTGHAIKVLRYDQSTGTRVVTIQHRDLRDERSAKPAVNVSIPIDNDYHDVFLSRNEHVLLLSMRAINTLGQEDIYICWKLEDGTWTKPANLGPAINTSGFEISPFLSDDGTTLYFASNGREGLGDADIYFSQRLDEGWLRWSEPVNLGPPVNSPHFDAYLSLGQHQMFFASNRNGGYADIYRAVLSEDKEPSVLISSTPVDNPTSDHDRHLPNRSILSVGFEFDDHTLGEKELEKLRHYAKSLQEIDALYVVIYGYTDDMGSRRYNRRLSTERANTVRDQLIRFGMPADHLTTSGRGYYTLPDAPTRSPSEKRVVHVLATQFLE